METETKKLIYGANYVRGNETLPEKDYIEVHEVYGLLLKAKEQGVKEGIKHTLDDLQIRLKKGSCYFDDICEILLNFLHNERANVNKNAIQKDLEWLMSLYTHSN